MQLSESKTDSLIIPTINNLLLILAATTLILLSPYFIWGNQLIIFRATHLVGNVIILYIILRHHNLNIFNKAAVVFFFLAAVYSMIGGTENYNLTYIPLLALFYVALKPIEQKRVFEYFITILSIVYVVGLVSYLMSLLGLNIQIGTAIAPNLAKQPYSVYFGHAEESGLIVYRFSSIFDEAGVVGTLNGLILASIGISTRNFKSMIILLTGLISFSLAFYIILIFILIFNLEIKKLVIIVILTIALISISGNLFNELIASRMTIENGRLAGDNRTHDEFNIYYDHFISKGGKDLFFGKGVGTTGKAVEATYVSSYKTAVVNYGIFGTGLIIIFYAISVYFTNNTKKGWFLGFIFLVSAYQRPDLLNFYTIVLFLGGLSYLKLNFNKTEDISNNSIN